MIMLKIIENFRWHK